MWVCEWNASEFKFDFLGAKNTLREFRDISN